MGRDDLCISVPSFFKCPISLDVMKSPVSLCTGVTYDRSSIQRWLDGGNNTCPATMQVLQTKDFVPNHTLQRLIQIWSDSVRARRGDVNTTTPPQLTQEQARDLAAQIYHHKNSQNRNCSESVSKLVSFAKDSDQNRKFLAAIDGFVPLLFKIIINSDMMIENKNYAEETFILLELILHEYRDLEYLTKLIAEKRDCIISSIVFVLRQGNLASRIASARVLEFVAADSDSKLYFAEHSDVLSELFRLVSSESDSDAIETALSTLICLSKRKRIRVRLVQIGAVKLSAKLLSDSNSSVAVKERVLELLEMLSSCKEGRAEMGEEDGGCVSAIVRKMLKVSAAATEHAVAILWSLCCLFRDRAAQEAVARSNGVTKILLLMQSNCSPAVRQMAGDLLKIFRVNSKSCLSSYDTNTTHIMPF